MWVMLEDGAEAVDLSKYRKIKSNPEGVTLIADDGKHSVYKRPEDVEKLRMIRAYLLRTEGAGSLESRAEAWTRSRNQE